MTKHIYKLLLFIGLIFSTSCTKVYYVGESTTPINIYATADTTTASIYTIPSKTYVLIKKRARTYPALVYESYEGFAYKPLFINIRKFNSSRDGNLYGYSTIKPTTPSSYSPSRAGSKTRSSGGTVQVKGYTRKDGTYVAPHTRKAPTRRK